MKQYLDALKQIIETGVDREWAQRLHPCTVRHADALQYGRRFSCCHNQETGIQSHES